MNAPVQANIFSNLLPNDNMIAKPLSGDASINSYEIKKKEIREQTRFAAIAQPRRHRVALNTVKVADKYRKYCQ
jgi:hypothetical protein